MTQAILSPAIILAGVKKCGTTTLFDMLARHSKIVPAAIKESQFFACDPDTIRANLSWYESLFRVGNHQTLLDGSTWYFGSPHSPRMIKECFADACVVICLRDPADRAASHYLHCKKQIPSVEWREFDTIVSDIGEHIRQGLTIYEAEDQVLARDVSLGLVDADYIGTDFHRDRFGADFPTHLADRRFEFRYLAESMYSRWLPAWDEIFGDRLVVVSLEELKLNPREVVERILAVSGLPLEENAANLVQSNKTRLPRGPISKLMLTFRKESPIGRSAAAMLKRSAGLKRLGAAVRNRLLYRDREADVSTDAVRELLRAEYEYWQNRAPAIAVRWKAPGTGKGAI